MKIANELTMGELFCGPGGIALGAKQASTMINGETWVIKSRFASDYDRDTCDTYRNNVGEEGCEVLCSDVRTLDIGKLPRVSGLSFGFPCNDFSMVGESKGLNGTFGPLYQYGVQYLEKHQPEWFVAENVSGLTSANEGKAFEMILSALVGAGYVVSANLYKFEQYGVPQCRHRVILVGIRKDLGKHFAVPRPTHTAGTYVTAGQALADIPAWASSQEHTKQSPTVIERLKHIKAGENVWTANLPEHLKLQVKGAKLSNIYKRLDPAKPSYTVTGSGGGGTHMYHWSEDRALTNRERARLQTFPDQYVFSGSKESVRKQIGMAVPPAGAKVIFKALLKTLAGKSYPSVEPSLGLHAPSVKGVVVPAFTKQDVDLIAA